jgi:hypothetical protein
LKFKCPRRGQAWWFTLVIPTLGRLRQENHKFQVSLDYIVRPCLKTNPQNKKYPKTSLQQGVRICILCFMGQSSVAGKRGGKDLQGSFI